MRTIDFAPYRRSTVGFDRLFDLLERTTRPDQAEGYPPFDLERRGEDQYRITIAVAGFRRDEVDITAQQNLLVVTGRKDAGNRNGGEGDRGQYLHVGIATRAFERRFQLADFVRVEHASLADGLLVIDLVREVPEAMKPQKIAIAGAPKGEDEGEPVSIEDRRAA